MLHAYWTAISQIVEGDVNGDKKADFSIELQRSFASPTKQHGLPPLGPAGQSKSVNVYRLAPQGRAAEFVISAAGDPLSAAR